MTPNDVNEVVRKVADILLIPVTPTPVSALTSEEMCASFRTPYPFPSVTLWIYRHSQGKDDGWLLGLGVQHFAEMQTRQESGTLDSPEQAESWLAERLFHQIDAIWEGIPLSLRLYVDKLVLRIGPFSNNNTEREVEIHGHQDMVRAYFKDEIPLDLLMEYLMERAPAQCTKFERLLA